MTVVCRVEKRFPVVVAALCGTLDRSSAIDAVVTLRGLLAEQPVLLLLDTSQLDNVREPALAPLAGLVRNTRRWPGTMVAVSGASSLVRAQLGRLAGAAAVDFYRSVADGVAAGHRLPVPPQEAVELAPHRDAPAASREVVARACQRWGLDRWCQLTQLLASELVTNAVVHAGTPISFTMRHPEGTLQVAVQDRDPRLVAEPPAGPGHLPTGEPGRGLLLLTTLASDWGSTSTSDGKVTWATVALAPDRPAAG